MQTFKIFQMLLMVVTWTNVEVEVPVYSSISEYITIPKAELSSNGSVFHDDLMYYVYDGVDTNYLTDIDTNYVRKVRYMIKAVFPTYSIESKKEIILNIVDKVKPTFITVPHFKIQVGEKIPDVKSGLEFKDNYYLQNEIIVNVLSLDTVNNKKIGKYPFTYELIDPSNNAAKATSYIEVVDTIAPFIEKQKDIKLEIGEAFNVRSFYKFSDNHDDYVSVTTDISNVNFYKVGTYYFYITATDQSGNKNTISDTIEIVHTGKPEIILYSNNLSIEVGTSDYQERIIENIKRVTDKVDNLTPEDVLITHLININKLDKYQVEYKVKNSFGTASTVLINVSIVDTTRPTIKVLSDLIIPYGIKSFILQNHFEISDNYDDYSDLSINTIYKINFELLGEYPIRIEVTDRSKNRAVFEGVIRVVDLEPPVFLTDQDEIVVGVYSNYDFTNFLISDNYDKNPKLNLSTETFSEVGSFTINLIAIDSSGNQSEKLIIVNVIDDEPPTIILTTNEIKLSMGSNRINPFDYIDEVYDNYDNLEINDVKIFDTIDYNELGIYELIYYLCDNYGNETYQIIIVKIDDTTRPVITTTDQIIKYKSKFNIWSGVLVTDNDPNLKLYAYPNYIDTSKLGTYEITYIAVDTRGNMSKAVRVIKVQDQNLNIKTYLYIMVNFIITSIATGGAYLYFKNKKRKWLFLWTFSDKLVIIIIDIYNMKGRF